MQWLLQMTAFTYKTIKFFRNDILGYMDTLNYRSIDYKLIFILRKSHES